jgi:hypothetical protein
MAVVEQGDSRVGRILFILAAIFLIGLIIYRFIDNAQKTANIDVLVAPESAQVLIGGNHFSNKTHKIKPGEYDVSVTKNGFESYNTKLTIKAGETTQLKVFLLPSDGSYDWYNKHPEDALLLDPIKDYNYTKNLDELKKHNPIINILPIQVSEYSDNYSKYTEFKINYKQSDSEKIIVTIDDVTGNNKDKALDMIRTKGFNPNDYTIEYNYTPN